MPAQFINQLAFLALGAVFFCSCSLTELPEDDLIPTSGRISDTAPEVRETEASRGEEPNRSKLPLRPLERVEMGGDLGVTEPFPEYNREPLPASTRILLVAGGAGEATFLQEIVVLRDYWMSQGYRADQIACYYVKPEKGDYEADRRRFDSMATRTQSCYLAAPHVLFRHLKTVASAKPQAIHLYVNGLGKAPMNATSEERALAAEFPTFAGCHRIVLRGGPSGHMNERMRLEALRDGIDAHYLVFNAQFLAEALNEFPAACEKFVVLNADYAGGFLTSSPGENGLLRGLPNVTVLASAKHDRKNSAEGGELSQFGGLYLSALSSESGRIEARSWRKMANEVLVSVDRSEGNAGVRTRLRSRPEFFSNLPRESGDLAELASELAVSEEETARMLPVSGLPAPRSANQEGGSALPAPRPVSRPKSGPGAAPVVSEAVKVEDEKPGAPRAVVSPRSGSGFGSGRGLFSR